MFARFDENPAMTLEDIKETKRYGGTHAHTGGRENSIPTTNKVCGGYNYIHNQCIATCSYTRFDEANLNSF